MESIGSGGGGQGRCTWCSVAEQGISLEDWIWRGEGRGEGRRLAFLVPWPAYLVNVRW